jgi:hypothetical protein
MAAGLLFVYTDVGAGPVAEADYHDWYDHEHGPARLTVPGLTGAVLSEPGYRAAVSTPWRDRIVSGALSRERRVLGFRSSF